MKKCILNESKKCNNCSECDYCEFDNKKKCNNCMKCINDKNCDYAQIVIDEIIMGEKNNKK